MILLNQEGHLFVTGKSYLHLVLIGLSLPSRLTDWLKMTVNRLTGPYIHKINNVLFFFWTVSLDVLILILLNKLSLPHLFLSVNQSDNSMLSVQINSQTE